MASFRTLEASRWIMSVIVGIRVEGWFGFESKLEATTEKKLRPLHRYTSPVHVWASCVKHENSRKPPKKDSLRSCDTPSMSMCVDWAQSQPARKNHTQAAWRAGSCCKSRLRIRGGCRSRIPMAPSKPLLHYRLSNHSRYESLLRSHRIESSVVATT